MLGFLIILFGAALIVAALFWLGVSVNSLTQIVYRLMRKIRHRSPP